MPKTHLTDIGIKSLKPPARGQITYWDTVLPSFGVRVSQGGTKSFTILHGKDRRRITVGRYPAVSLSQARAEAKRLLAEITLGKDRPPAISFSEALDLFLTTHCRQRNKPATAKETERLLRKHFLPKLRRYALDEITTHHITTIVDRLLPTPSEACHAFTAVRTFFRWCTRRRYIPHSPCEGLQLPTKPNSKDHVLSDQELVHVFRACELYGWPCGNIFLLLLLTGQRRGEIGALRWHHIELDQRLITFPASLTKNNRQHTFPYGDMAARIIESIPKSGDLLFPARGNADKAFSGWSKGKIKLDRTITDGGVEVSPWTLHDLRRSFATNLAALGTPIQVTEKLLNHVSGTVSGVAAIYNRHTYMDEMRAAIDAWERKLAQLLEEHPPET